MCSTLVKTLINYQTNAIGDSTAIVLHESTRICCAVLFGNHTFSYIVYKVGQKLAYVRGSSVEYRTIRRINVFEATNAEL